MTIQDLSIEGEVRQLLIERARQGMATYGKPLTTWDGRESLTDALEEAADLVVYLAKARRELRELGFAVSCLLENLPPVLVPGETTYPVPARDLLRLRELWNRATGVTK